MMTDVPTVGFYQALLARCVAGLLNGNIVVLKTFLGAITDESNRSRGTINCLSLSVSVLHIVLNCLLCLGLSELNGRVCGATGGMGHRVNRRTPLGWHVVRCTVPSTVPTRAFAMFVRCGPTGTHPVCRLW